MNEQQGGKFASLHAFMIYLSVIHSDFIIDPLYPLDDVFTKASF